MAEVAALLPIATGLASVAVKEACKRTLGMLKPYADGGIRSAFLGGLKPQISSLADELQKMQAILRDAEKMNPAQRSKNDNDLVLQWLTSVKDAARFADDVLDEILYEEIRVKVERRRWSLRRKACNFISGSNGVLFGMKMSRKIRKITSMIAGFYREARDIGLKPVKLLRNDHQFSTQIMVMNEDLRDVRANVDASEIVGRQRDQKLIVDELCQDGADRDFSVVAIVGMSGIGKTTLARRAYDNELVVKHFQERVWISVADKFDLKRLLNEMLESVTKTKSKLCNTDAIEKKLQGCLKEKRYLLVLDDVWSTGTEHWDSMRGSLRRIGGSVGSTVLVTARNNEVASVMKASLPHHLEELSDHESWEMFKKIAFANKTHEQMSNLDAVGRRMLKRCHGVPLAIKTLACLLQSKNEEHEWQSIESSKVWDLQIGNKIMPSLLLSFYHLPSASLKRCFAYSPVILPKGCTRQACSLIEIWMAQGLLQSVGETDLPPEDIGREHMNILLSNGLLQAVSYNIHGHVIECCMHDLMHDMALYVSKDTSLIVDKAKKLDLLRTLVCSRKIPAKLEVLPRCLRVLILNCGLKEVPASIAGLRHLRYLDLSKNHFRSLPGSIGDLYMLQTLNLMCCDNLVQLPEQITDLVNLRHVYTSECVVLPLGMGRLKCLQTLPKINLKPKSGWRIEELGSLPNVRNLLLLKGVEHIKSREEAKQAKLEFKEGIFELILIWNMEQATGDMGRDEDVMDGLKPHSNLRDLWVENYNGKRFPPWLSDENILRNLKLMSFCNCKCDQLPELGCLPSLQSIEIDGMQSLKLIGTEWGKRIMFPQLKTLKLKNMPNLEYWSEPVGSEAGFPCLEELEIKDCPKLSTASTGFSLLRKLTVRGIKSGQPLQMILSKGSKLTSLVSLTIQMVSELTSLPEGLSECTSLVDIKILRCESLTHLPVSLGRLHWLESFQVKHCRSLKSLPDFHGLSSLRKLTIVKCKALKQAPLGLDSCTSMKEMVMSGCSCLKLVPDLNPMGSHEMLRIYGFHQQQALPGWLSNLSKLRVLGIGKFCKDLESFPDISQLPRSLVALDIKGGRMIKCLPSQLQSFTQLKCLGLFDFNGVETIPQWLGNLSSLEDLRIGKCRSLKSLPPLTAMERLVKLRRLEIKKCPLLEEKCADCGGEEWHKIAGIPHVIVNKKEIQKAS